MACNCGGNSARRRRTTLPTTAAPPSPAGGGYVLRMPDGSQTTYVTRLEADAARVRSGYRGTVTKA